MNLHKRTFFLLVLVLPLVILSEGCSATKSPPNARAENVIIAPSNENEPDLPASPTIANNATEPLATYEKEAALGTDENELGSDGLIPREVVLPILGVKMDGYENNSFNMTYPRAVAVSEDSVLSITKLSGDLEICWYIDDDVPNCSYRRQDGEWMHFLTENSAYRDGFGAALYNDLFGYSGFYILCPRGAAYYARDYYYFDESGELKLLFSGVHMDAISDFNHDGATELLWFYHAGGDTDYYYTVGEDIFMFDIIEALKTSFSDWEYIYADPLSLRDDTYTDEQAVPENVCTDILRINYQCHGIDYYALISFGPNEIFVSTDHE